MHIILSMDLLSYLQHHAIVCYLKSTVLYMLSLNTVSIDGVGVVDVGKVDCRIEILQTVDALFDGWVRNLGEPGEFVFRVEGAVEQGDVGTAYLADEIIGPAVHIGDIEKSFPRGENEPDTVCDLISVGDPERCARAEIVRGEVLETDVAAFYEEIKWMVIGEKLLHGGSAVDGKIVDIRRLFPQIPQSGAVSKMRVGEENSPHWEIMPKEHLYLMGNVRRGIDEIPTLIR